MKKIFQLKLILLPLILILTCSKNPFSDGKVNNAQQIKIEGTATLSDHGIEENIFVWLEGFQVSTWTDKNGNFKLTLPEIPTNNDNLNGIYKIYYYVANYKIKTSSITIINGQIEKNLGDIAMSISI